MTVPTEHVGLRPRGTHAGEILRGDDTGATETLVYLDRELVGRFDEWNALERTLGQAGRLRVDPAGCQFLLAYGLVPPPYTLYSDVYRLGVGDRLEMDPHSERASFRVDFPYREAASRGAGDASTTALKARLVEAVAASIPASGPVTFLQSSGKDSAGLLLALAECGASAVEAFTYDAGWREREGAPAAEMARRFGVRHAIVEADPAEECAAYLRFAEKSPALCADLALFPYLRTLEVAGVSGGRVLDGLGNDVYMGYLEPRRDAWLGALSLPRRAPSTWGAAEPPSIGARGAYLWKSMLMYPTERSLAGSRLAPRTVLELLPHPSPFQEYFPRLDRSLRGWSAIDRRAYVRGRIFDGCGTMLKARLAAASRGAQASFPYCDGRLVEHCFHLPADERYDSRSGTNKLPLRRLLAEEIGDSPYLAAKGSFRFDVLRFVEVNEPVIRRELTEARPLLARLDRWARFLLARRRNYVHAYLLTTLFMLAAWLNRKPGPVVGDLRAGGGHRASAGLTVEP